MANVAALALSILLQATEDDEPFAAARDGAYDVGFIIGYTLAFGLFFAVLALPFVAVFFIVRKVRRRRHSTKA